MKMITRRCLCLLSVMLLMFLVTACVEQPEQTVQEEGMYQVYYVSNNESKVEVHNQKIKSQTSEEQLLELINYLAQVPEKLEYKAPLSMGFKLQDILCEDGKLQLDMNEAYQELPPMTEILVRAALVKTLCQLDEVNLVQITVNGGPVYDPAGDPVSWMSAEQFISNDGNEINSYEHARIMLYFASEDGKSLLAAYRDKYYMSTAPLERIVVEELLAGPSGQVSGLYPTINPTTKIINVTTKDGICYVNLDSSFLTVVNNVPIEVSVYSIVNSLAELSNINKVQILINGETPANLSASGYERNLDIVTAWER